jgi:phosphate/phosphite/phosphonate ABC transporter binding protein
MAAAVGSATEAMPPPPGSDPESRGEGISPGPIARPPGSGLDEDPLLKGIPPANGARILGGVQLVKRIGQGGMGAVYSGYHLTLDTTVAVKILPIHLTADSSFAERFLREAKVSFNIDHHNIVRTLNAGKEHGLHFLQMEFIDGYSAGELVRQKGRIPEPQAIKIVLDATHGLAEAHSRGIIHRDVKPDNILIRSADGRAKIADLGLARIVGGASTSPVITGAGTTLGTPAYMAPEQIEDASHAGAAADIYSLGATLFELVCGRPPFQAPSLPSLFREILALPAPDPETLRPGISPRLKAVITRSLAKKPGDRYADAPAFALALEQALAEASPAVPTPLPPISTTGPFSATATYEKKTAPPGALTPSGVSTIAPDPGARKRRRVIAGILVGLAIVVSLFLGWFLGVETPTTPGRRPLVLGILPDRQLTQQRLNAMEPVRHFLEHVTRQKVELLVGESYGDVVDRFVHGDLDIAQLGGVTYVLAKEREPGVIPLFQRETDQKFRGTIITRAASPIASLADLKGKRFAFVDQLSTAGYVIPCLELLDAGIDPSKDFVQIEYCHGHDAVIEAVVKGNVDAGAIDGAMQDRLQLRGKLDRSELKTLKVSASFLDDVWVASPKLEPALREKVKQAFLALDALRSTDNATLLALEANRYVPASDAQYEDIRKKVETLRAKGLLKD